MDQTPINVNAPQLQLGPVQADQQKRPWLQIIAIGQLISFLLTGTSVFTYMLVNHRPIMSNTTKCQAKCNDGPECQGINIPVLQSMFTYLLLSLHMML